MFLPLQRLQNAADRQKLKQDGKGAENQVQQQDKSIIGIVPPKIPADPAGMQIREGGKRDAAKALKLLLYVKITVVEDREGQKDRQKRGGHADDQQAVIHAAVCLDSVHDKLLS